MKTQLREGSPLRVGWGHNYAQGAARFCSLCVRRHQVQGGRVEVGEVLNLKRPGWWTQRGGNPARGHFSSGHKDRALPQRPLHRG